MSTELTVVVHTIGNIQIAKVHAPRSNMNGNAMNCQFTIFRP